jgi:hypothetical protein
MTNEEKLTLLLKVLKEYAETKTCYDRDKFYDIYDEKELDESVVQAEEYGEIHLARTLLEQIGVEFEYPCMKEND